MSDVQHAEILHIGPVPNPNGVNISSNNGVEPHTAVLSHDHIADDRAGFLDETGFRDGGFYALKGADHGPHCRGIGLLRASPLD
jgi:hypothetical protein